MVASLPPSAVDFSTRTVSAGGRSLAALVVRPTADVKVDHSRLSLLRDNPDRVGRIDEAIYREARRHQPTLDLVVFRCQGGTDGGSWQFDPQLFGEEAAELGYLLMRSQLVTYRRLIHTGIRAVFHTGMGFREVRAYRTGTERLLKELDQRAKSEARRKQAEADRWLLRHLTFFFSIPFEKVINETIPTMLPHLEQRERPLRRMLESIPPPPA
jgi:hypothetical protein